MTNFHRSQLSWNGLSPLCLHDNTGLPKAASILLAVELPCSIGSRVLMVSVVTNPMVMHLGWLVVFRIVYSLAHVQPQTYASCLKIFLFEARFWAPYIN